jgi:hypothetical protein
MLLRVLAAVLVLGVSAVAAAEPPAGGGTPTVSPAIVNGRPTAQADATATVPPAPDPMICKYHAATTGSRLGGSKVCLKRSQWEDNQRAAREVLDNSIRGSATTNCTPTLGNGGGC